MNLLRSFGAMPEREVLRYRDPVPNPSSGFFEGIMIDDHLGLQLLRRQATLAATLGLRAGLCPRRPASTSEEAAEKSPPCQGVGSRD